MYTRRVGVPRAQEHGARPRASVFRGGSDREWSRDGARRPTTRRTRSECSRESVREGVSPPLTRRVRVAVAVAVVVVVVVVVAVVVAAAAAAAVFVFVFVVVVVAAVVVAVVVVVVAVVVVVVVVVAVAVVVVAPRRRVRAERRARARVERGLAVRRRRPLGHGRVPRQAVVRHVLAPEGRPPQNDVTNQNNKTPPPPPPTNPSLPFRAPPATRPSLPPGVKATPRLRLARHVCPRALSPTVRPTASPPSSPAAARGVCVSARRFEDDGGVGATSRVGRPRRPRRERRTLERRRENKRFLSPPLRPNTVPTRRRDRAWWRRAGPVVSTTDGPPRRPRRDRDASRRTA